MHSKVSPGHTYCLILVYLLGTSILFGTPQLVPDTWLVEIVTLFFASFLFILYTGLIGTGRNISYYALLEKAWGKAAGKALVLSYTVYFIYIAARNLRDMIELVMTSLLRSTPEDLLVIPFVILVAYASAGSLAVLGRLSVLIAALIILFFTALGILLILSHSVDLERLLPLFTGDFRKIASTVLENTIWFPYGEMIVFLVFFPAMGQKPEFRRTGLAALLSAGVLLIAADVLQTATLGKENIKFSSFPLLDAARMINIYNFITRMDALVALIIIFGVLLKCAIFLAAAVKGAGYVFKSSKQKVLLPLSLLIGALSLLVTQNSAEHISEGLNIVIFCLHIPAQCAIPAATALLIMLRKRKGKLHD
ncbi:hypothetical protein AWJ19_11275 [Paenibacillus sp. DMB5]|nr:hypothetical protein AWJ19_11275 [Paenibacillus sp. DMB5]